MASDKPVGHRPSVLTSLLEDYMNGKVVTRAVTAISALALAVGGIALAASANASARPTKLERAALAQGLTWKQIHNFEHAHALGDAVITSHIKALPAKKVQGDGGRPRGPRPQGRGDPARLRCDDRLGRYLLHTVGYVDRAYGNANDEIFSYTMNYYWCHHSGKPAGPTLIHYQDTSDHWSLATTHEHAGHHVLSAASDLGWSWTGWDSTGNYGPNYYTWGPGSEGSTTDSQGAINISTSGDFYLSVGYGPFSAHQTVACTIDIRHTETAAARARVETAIRERSPGRRTVPERCVLGPRRPAHPEAVPASPRRSPSLRPLLRSSCLWEQSRCSTGR